MKNDWSKYPVTIALVPEEDGKPYYMAWLPDFGKWTCSATGDTREEALKALGGEVPAVIEHYMSVNRLLPAPTEEDYK